MNSLEDIERTFCWKDSTTPWTQSRIRKGFGEPNNRITQWTSYHTTEERLKQSLLVGRYYPGRFSQLSLEGDPDSLLELSDLLMKVEERSEVALDSAGVETSSSKYEALDALRLEIRNGGLLLIKHEGSTLHIEGSKEIMEKHPLPNR